MPGHGPISLVLCTAPAEEADALARRLVEARLAACVSRLGPVRSVYRWEGAVEESEELLLLIKTPRARVAELRETLTRWHSYDVPEILEFTADSGLDSYLGWVDSSCR